MVAGFLSNPHRNFVIFHIGSTFRLWLKIIFLPKCCQLTKNLFNRTNQSKAHASTSQFALITICPWNGQMRTKTSPCSKQNVTILIRLHIFCYYLYSLQRFTKLFLIIMKDLAIIHLAVGKLQTTFSTKKIFLNAKTLQKMICTR